MEPQTLEGKEVTVECFGGKLTVVHVYRDLGSVLEVCKPEEMRAAQSEGREPVTIGFRRDSVVEIGKGRKAPASATAPRRESSKAGD